MFPRWFNDKVRRFTGAFVARTLGRTSLTATELTVAGLLLILVASWMIASGALFWGGIVLIVASSFDMLDGALARAKNEASRLGAFLDSTIDRYAEVALFLGLLFHYSQTNPTGNEIWLIYVALSGSLLVSYVRARAEAVGFECKVGLLERPERIIMLIIGLVIGWMTIILWALAILTHVTAIQRIVHVVRQARAEQAPRPRRRWRSAGNGVE